MSPVTFHLVIPVGDEGGEAFLNAHEDWIYEQFQGRATLSVSEGQARIDCDYESGLDVMSWAQATAERLGYDVGEVVVNTTPRRAAAA